MAMKRLVLIDSGEVRTFRCAGCKWTFPVQEFSAGLSEAEIGDDFRDHYCDDPRFRYETTPEQQTLPPADSSCPSVDGTRILQDLCGLKGAVLASIESLSSNQSGAEELAQLKAELDRLRSLLWLHLPGSKR